jgi:hypothetical protein
VAVAVAVAVAGVWLPLHLRVSGTPLRSAVHARCV